MRCCRLLCQGEVRRLSTAFSGRGPGAQSSAGAPPTAASADTVLTRRSARREQDKTFASLDKNGNGILDSEELDPHALYETVRAPCIGKRSAR